MKKEQTRNKKRELKRELEEKQVWKDQKKHLMEERRVCCC